jgi:hypothetical protein
MKRNRIVSASVGLLLAVTGTVGLAACGSSDDSGSDGDSSASTETEVDVAEDLENARQAVADALAEDDSWAQIMLASDVDSPTVKYGLLVVPYSFSDAASRVQGTVNITDGDYTIEADSAATDQTWQIDQDGAITEVTG